MASYATKSLFAGRPAVIHDAVVLAAPKHNDPTKVCLHAGTVVAVTADRPYIKDERTGEMDFDAPRWKFVETHSREDIENMPLGSWTWPIALAA